VFQGDKFDITYLYKQVIEIIDILIVNKVDPDDMNLITKLGVFNKI